MDIPDGMLVLGSPAKIVKPLKEGTIARSRENSAHYAMIKDIYLKQGIGKPELPGKTD